MERDYNKELREAIDVLKGMKGNFEPKSNEENTRFTLINLGEKILLEFNNDDVHTDEFLKIKTFCNRIIGFWGGGGSTPSWLRRHLSKLSSSAIPPSTRYAEERRKEIKQNCLNLIKAFINMYGVKKRIA